MDSLDEFAKLEFMLNTSEDSLLKHQRKKHKTDMDKTNNNNNNNNGNVDNCANSKMEFLEDIIVNELNNHSDLSRRDELIKKLCNRLRSALQNNEEIKKSENGLVEEMEDIKQQIRQISSQVHQHKDSIRITTTNNNKQVKCSECQTNLPLSSHFLNLDESTEICRRQAQSVEKNLIQSNRVVVHDSDTGQLSKRDIDIQTDGDNCVNDVCTSKVFLDQIKQLEENIQSERQFYFTENERLNTIIDEKCKEIDELKNEQKQSTAAKSSTSSTSRSFADQSDASKDYSRLQGYNSQTNNRLLHVLSDLVKTFLDTENDIQKQLETLGLENKSIGLKTDDNLLGFPSLEEERLSEITFDLCDDGPDLTPSSMIYSNQSLTINGGNDIEDDVVLGASRRLRQAVERVLKILSQIVDNHSQYDLKELFKQKDELAAELHDECQRSDKLTRQLLDKEKLLHSSANEMKILKEQLVDYSEIKNQYDELKLKLEEYEVDRDRFVSDNQRLEQEKHSFSQGLPQLQQNSELANENENLNRTVQQLQQDKANLLKKINLLTAEVESIKSEKEQLLETKNLEFQELLSQIDSTEKNLNSLKRFVEEQTQERECEREEYNKEISSLKEKLKEKEKNEMKFKSLIRSLENQNQMYNEDKNYKDEQIEELTTNLKEANIKLSEKNILIRQLESDIERNNQIELELRNKMKELSNALDIKLNDKTNWEDLIDMISKFAESKSGEPADKKNTNSALIDSKIEQLDLSSQSDNSFFCTIKMMDDRISSLNEHIDGLISRNNELKKELVEKENRIKLIEINNKADKEILEKNLKQSSKTNSLLQQEINENHMKYSELKVKLESSVDVNEYKKVVSELQTKLNLEKQQTESTSLKLEQANRHIHELNDKLDAYKKEIKSYKELLKSYEHENKHSTKNKNDIKTKFDDAVSEVGVLNNKLSNKDKTIDILEQNVDMLKLKVNSLNKEKEYFFEQMKSFDENRNTIVMYEKNLDKLRLQNKIFSDKITYLELEIQNLKKKIGLLERENEFLKNDNHKLYQHNNELNAATLIESDGDNVDSLAITSNVNNANINYLNGFDKMNSISSNNVLMLKVRRLLSQKGALVYQKNYLIHVLGGFQMTENATLALLANYNNSKDVYDDEGKLRGKQKFRSVAYALIALSRMKFFVNIWQCRKRQLFLNKTALSISNNLQNLPVPPKKVQSQNKQSSSSSSNSSSPIHHPQHSHLNGHKHSMSAQINSTLKDYVDRLHVVHEKLGLHTNKL